MSEGLVGIIGGTGFGDLLSQQLTGVQLEDVVTPFGKPSTPITIGRFGKRRIALINRHGTGHKLSPSEVLALANVFALKSIGVHTLISSGAVGSLQEKITPGDLVVVDQFIDKTYKRRNTFFEGYAAVHCEMDQPVCGRLREEILSTAKTIRTKTHPKGTYICMEGPQFSTRAESLMHRNWGGDLIGMTAMPEAKLAREAQMCYCLIALVSDYDCWQIHKVRKDKQTLLAEIMTNLKTATNNCLRLVESILASDSELGSKDCRCRKSLELAVWTNPDYIDAARRKKLNVLFE